MLHVDNTAFFNGLYDPLQNTTYSITTAQNTGTLLVNFNQGTNNNNIIYSPLNFTYLSTAVSNSTAG